MKTALKVLAVVVVLSVALLGCSQSGFLTVENNTAGPVDVSVGGEDETIDAGEDMGWEYEFPGVVLNLIKQETESVDIEWIGLYALPGDDTEEIEAGDDVVFGIDANAGAFAIVNSNPSPVTEVYISASDDSSWGQNRAGSNISTGQRADFGPFGSVSWDMKIINFAGTFWQVFGLFTTVNQALVFTVGADNYLTWNEPGAGAILPMAGHSAALKDGPR